MRWACIVAYAPKPLACRYEREVLIASSACPSAHGREQVFAILREVADSGLAVMVIIHDPALAARADRRLHIVDGKTERCLGAADGRARFAAHQSGRWRQTKVLRSFN